MTHANKVWRSAGIQFWVRAVECYVAPHFSSPGDNEETWSTAYAELGGAGKPLPNMPSDAWTPSTAQKTAHNWLAATSTVWSWENEILVWTTTYGNQSSFPENGRWLFMSASNMASLTDSYKLAHELGHYFGQYHPVDVATDTRPDPETLVPKTMADFWDLVYKPGNPHTFTVQPNLRSQRQHVRNAEPLRSFPNTVLRDGRWQLDGLGKHTTGLCSCGAWLREE